MQCDKFRLKISEYIDGELSDKESKAVLKHIKECENCRKVFDAYAAVSKNIREAMPQIPEDFKVVLPNRRRSVFTLIRGYEGIISAVAAAITLIIFAGGIENDTYKVPTGEITKTAPPAAAIMPAFENEEDHGKNLKNSEENKAMAEDKALKSTETAKSLKTADEISAPARVSQSAPVEGQEKTGEEAKEEVKEEVKEENTQADIIPRGIAVEKQLTKEETDESEPTPARGGGGAASGGGTAGAKMNAQTEAEQENNDEIRNKILNYSMPQKESFSDENVYESLFAKLKNLKARAESGNAENLEEEFNALIREIEKGL